MNLIQAVLLGIVQGLTEFLPISSSGHLVLVPWLLGWRFDPTAAFIFDVLVQLGTLVAVIIYFRADLANLMRAAIKSVLAGDRSSEARLAWGLLLATIPAALAGVLLKDLVEEAFASPPATGGFLLLTGLILLLAERVSRHARSLVLEDVTPSKALWIGLAQVLSLFPGISRSGATISGGLAVGLERVAAARFSFLMAVPIMLGAGLVAILDLAQVPDAPAQVPALLGGFLSAAIVGYLSIHWLLGHLVRGRLNGFAVYCIVVGTAAVLIGFFT